MEIEENVNPRMEQTLFSEIPVEKRQNMQSQLVACDSRNRPCRIQALHSLRMEVISINGQPEEWPQRLVGCYAKLDGKTPSEFPAGTFRLQGLSE